MLGKIILTNSRINRLKTIGLSIKPRHQTANKYVALLGGTFSPIHNGHLRFAIEIKRQLPIDEVWLIPNYVSPHKQHKVIIPAYERLAMCQNAAKPYPFIKVSDFEIRKGAISYTHETVKYISEQHPNTCFFFAVSMDQALSFNAWNRLDIILDHCDFIVGSRPGYTPISRDALQCVSTNNTNTIFIDTGMKNDISSTMINKSIANQEPISHLVPQVIEEHLVTIAKNRIGEKINEK